MSNRIYQPSPDLDPITQVWKKRAPGLESLVVLLPLEVPSSRRALSDDRHAAFSYHRRIVNNGSRIIVRLQAQDAEPGDASTCAIKY